MQRGIATFTLDSGRCPPWLFARMTKFSAALLEVMVAEYGPAEVVKRLADPVWFQSLGTVAAFDWNASGLTTTLTAALKEALRGKEKELGLFICGGKGKTSRQTPKEIERWGAGIGLAAPQTDALVYNSKMSAKVDSALVQDGFQIYHHSFIFSRDGAWTVVQQGMNQQNQTARRYHWHSANIRDLIEEPHAGIASQVKIAKVLNLTAAQSSATRDLSLDLVERGFRQLFKDLTLLEKYATPTSQMARLKGNGQQLTLLELSDVHFRSHPVISENHWTSPYLQKILGQLCEIKPQSYEEFIAHYGVGPKTVRALALVAEVLYGARPSYADPARYSFAHGGKDYIPFPVDRAGYDQTITLLNELIAKTRLAPSEKQQAHHRLNKKIPVQ